MMRQPRSSQVHVSQAVPGASPLTWTMEGDAEINKVRLSKKSVFILSSLLSRSTCLRMLRMTPVHCPAPPLVPREAQVVHKALA